MLIASDDDQARKILFDLAIDVGFDAVEFGGLASSSNSFIATSRITT